MTLNPIPHPHHCPKTGGDCWEENCESGCQKMPDGGPGIPPKEDDDEDTDDDTSE
jgi:hypothetical protein